MRGSEPWDLDGDVAAIRNRGRYRRMRRIEGAEEPEVTVDGRPAILLCSNNYLGLATDPEVIQAACEAAERYGAGSGSSRLISGTLALHGALEERIAQWKGAERALVFASGYHANLGVIQALVGRGDLVLSDELNHASLIDGCRLSRAEVRVYPHKDLDRLASELVGARSRRVLIVTDSIFSMDGDRAPLVEICALAERHGAAVMVDEAHATGLLGERGSGLVEELGLRGRVLVEMGTLSKALGSFGAYVAGSSSLIELLVNRARTFIFTTGLPPAAVGAARAAIDIVEREPRRRAQVWNHARAVHAAIAGAGIEMPPLESPILPIVLGEEDRTMKACERLLERGVFVQGIRPPTVPPGTSRLRVTVMANHTDEQIARAGRAIVDTLAELR
ncbi:MAG TPA: 8-amino-7-oxononanoate synthase [Candidatus Binatia bacterium]|nr:8-amino-7-oxononanoate synthase [Candidatus Binatia bacterium]